MSFLDDMSRKDRSDWFGHIDNLRTVHWDAIRVNLTEASNISEEPPRMRTFADWTGSNWNWYAYVKAKYSSILDNLSDTELHSFLKQAETYYIEHQNIINTRATESSSMIWSAPFRDFLFSFNIWSIRNWQWYLNIKDQYLEYCLKETKESKLVSPLKMKVLVQGRIKNWKKQNKKKPNANKLRIGDKVKFKGRHSNVEGVLVEIEGDWGYVKETLVDTASFYVNLKNLSLVDDGVAKLDPNGLSQFDWFNFNSLGSLGYNTRLITEEWISSVSSQNISITDYVNVSMPIVPPLSAEAFIGRSSSNDANDALDAALYASMNPNLTETRPSPQFHIGQLVSYQDGLNSIEFGIVNTVVDNIIGITTDRDGLRVEGIAAQRLTPVEYHIGQRVRIVHGMRSDQYATVLTHLPEHRAVSVRFESDNIERYYIVSDLRAA